MFSRQKPSETITIEDSDSELDEVPDEVDAALVYTSILDDIDDTDQAAGEHSIADTVKQKAVASKRKCHGTNDINYNECYAKRQDKRFKCGHCLKLFGSANALVDHYIPVHQSKNNIVNCQ